VRQHDHAFSECPLLHVFKKCPGSCPAVNAATGQVLSIQRHWTTVLQAVTLIAGRKRQSLLMAGDDDEMFMTKSLNVMPKTTEQHI